MSNISWVDIAIALILIRGFYVVKKSNFIVEIFKLVGLISAVIVGLHFFSRFGKVLSEQFLVPENYKDICALIILTFVTIFIFRFIREGWLIILKINVQENFDKWGGVVVSTVKNILLCSLIVVGILISGRKDMVNSAKHSFSQGFFRPISIHVYKTAYDVFIAKYFHDEKINSKAVALLSLEKLKEIN